LDDSNPFVYPGAPEIPNNGLDEDCDGQDLILQETGLYMLRSFPEALKVGQNKEVMFIVRIPSIFTEPNNIPSYITLEEVDASGSTVLQELGNMLDDGTDSDIKGSDGTYTGSFMIDGQLQEDRYLRARAQALSMTEPVYSNTYRFSITPSPVEIQPSDTNKIIYDTENQIEIFSNEIIVKISQAASSETIQQIAQSVNGTVIGAIYGLGIYQIQITSVDEAANLHSKVQALYSYPEVINSNANYVIEPFAISINDPNYLPNQKAYLDHIRVPQAWNVARGGKTIAVIDDGVIISHNEFQGRVYGAWDIDDVNKSSHDPSPDPNDSHGTWVAGTIAAIQNNNQGLAGISWNSNIIAVKVASNHNLNSLACAKGVYVASFFADILNCSWGSYGQSSTIEEAITYAINLGECLVVAAAGNNYCYEKTYPASQNGVFAVGATEQTTDTVAIWSPDPNDPNETTYCPTDVNNHYFFKGSNVGSYIEIAAPGTNIFSTDAKGVDSYNTISGTSFAAPIVSAASSLVWSQHPEWSWFKVKEHIEKTAKPLGNLFNPGGAFEGAGRIDVFEAVFNGGFETGDFTCWQPQYCSAFYSTPHFAEIIEAVKDQHPNGNPLTDPNFIPPSDPDRIVNKYMLYVSTGLNPEDGWFNWIMLPFEIQPDLDSLKINLKINYITEEFPEFWGYFEHSRMDYFEVYIALPDGTKYHIYDLYDMLDENIELIQYDGIQFGQEESHYVDGWFMGTEDGKVGVSGWIPVSKTIDLSSLSSTQMKLVVEIQDGSTPNHHPAVYDTNIDSMLLIDCIELE